MAQRRDQSHLRRALCPWRVIHQKTSTHPTSERESCPLSKGMLSYSYYLIPTLMHVLHRAGHILTACSIQQRHKHLKWTIQWISSSLHAVDYLRCVRICNLFVKLKRSWRLPKSSNVWFPYSDGLEWLSLLVRLTWKRQMQRHTQKWICFSTFPQRVPPTLASYECKHANNNSSELLPLMLWHLWIEVVSRM